MADVQALIESVAGAMPRAKQEDFRTLMLAFYDQHTLQGNATGVSWLNPTSGAQQPQTAPPPIASVAVQGANAQYTVQITNPSLSVNSTLYHQVQYSPVKNFSQNVTTLPVSASTHITVPNPGSTLFFRYRSSVDQQNWNQWTLAQQSAVESGLQSAAATQNAVVFNQTNRASVDSVAASGSANVRVYGAAGGPQTMWIGIKGGATEPQETIFPSATITGVPYSTNQTVAYDPKADDYVVSPELPGVLPDTLVPVGQVPVVGSGPVTLPVITLIINNGFIINATFTPGSGLTQIPTITVNPGTSMGAGAQIVFTGISGGQVTGLQVTNIGNGKYDGSASATASGGVFSGGQGGGGIAGQNPGRLVPIIPVN